MTAVTDKMTETATVVFLHPAPSLIINRMMNNATTMLESTSVVSHALYSLLSCLQLNSYSNM